VPLPLAAVTVIHAALLVAVHVQPVAAVTATKPVPAADVTFADDGEIAGLHVVAAACVTVNMLPPTVSVPVRDAVVVFAATPNVTEPLPVPLAPALMVIQAALLVAVHAQPVAAVTTTVPAPAAAVTVADAGEIVGVQGAAAWVTVNVFPPMVRVPVRDVAVVFAATS
jgi:hypothetical protein